MLHALYHFRLDLVLPFPRGSDRVEGCAEGCQVALLRDPRRRYHVGRDLLLSDNFIRFAGFEYQSPAALNIGQAVGICDLPLRRTGTHTEDIVDRAGLDSIRSRSGDRRPAPALFPFAPPL